MGGGQPGMCGFHPCDKKNKGESSREKVCKRLFVFMTPKSIICPRYAFASPIPWAVFLLSPAVPAVYRSEEKEPIWLDRVRRKIIKSCLVSSNAAAFCRSSSSAAWKWETNNQIWLLRSNKKELFQKHAQLWTFWWLLALLAPSGWPSLA